MTGTLRGRHHAGDWRGVTAGRPQRDRSAARAGVRPGAAAGRADGGCRAEVATSAPLCPSAPPRRCRSKGQPGGRHPRALPVNGAGIPENVAGQGKRGHAPPPTEWTEGTLASNTNTLQICLKRCRVFPLVTLHYTCLPK